MSAKTMTLSEFLDLDHQVAKQSKKARSTLATNKDKIAVTAIPWAKLEEKIIEKLASFFDMKLTDLCVGAWKKYNELKEFADLEKHPENEENEVALLEHEVTSIHHPSLEITMGNAKLGTIDFDLNVTLTLEGADLTIQGGRITKVRLGKCQGVASLQWEKAELIKAESAKVNFGEPVPLPEPVRIEIGET